MGDHISRFEGSDLVFIGSNIPHLNFDYGIKTSYEKIVVHIKPAFLQHAFKSTPELSSINQLFIESRYGLSFGQQTKSAVVHRLKELNQLDHFDQFIELLSIMQFLSNSKDKSRLHKQPVKNSFNQKDQEKLASIYKFIDENFQRKIGISEIASLANMTNPAFCRYFKKMTKLTFTEFVNHYRIDKAKKLLLMDNNITESCFKCGFESISYFNKIFKKVTSENPLKFKKRFL